MIGHNIPWSQDDAERLVRAWHQNADIHPAARAVLLSPEFRRTQWAILRKAEKLGLIVSHERKRDGDSRPTGNDARIYRAISPEAAWRKAWRKAHGNRGYHGGPLA